MTNAYQKVALGLALIVANSVGYAAQGGVIKVMGAIVENTCRVNTDGQLQTRLDTCGKYAAHAARTHTETLVEPASPNATTATSTEIKPKRVIIVTEYL
ncbi:type 1 fimbria pilin [Silvimonas terrae]|uniref:Type 1 fimbria pilin n=1 Tax=Silvimonas terrae TaxID=300266 RepID=A0A840RHP3_9NEIS|nr:hypothetical protein [Silvimonas terrae]MBB5191846.1 type 1 fimbria pilin [Silvimonas terrae]